MIAAVFLLPPFLLPVFPEPRNYSVKMAACIICQDEDPSETGSLRENGRHNLTDVRRREEGRAVSRTVEVIDS